jgi:small-conductance mechanosensitive channel
MEALRRLLLHDPMEMVLPLVVFAVTLAIGYGIVRISRRILESWIRRTGSLPLTIVRDVMRGPGNLFALMLAIHVAIQTSDLPARYTRWGSRTLLVLLIFALTVMFARLAGNLIRHYGGQIPSALPVTTLTQNLAQLTVVILGILVLLNQLGIPITPILTALGVGGLAVALALQDTLSNLFSGFYVAVAGHMRLGDYIKLNTGEEGYVTDIGWRCTMIRALANNLIIVPNNKLAQAIVTNYYLPEKRMSVDVKVGVGYECDPDRVERILLEVVQQAARDVAVIVPEPPPSVMFDPGFGESSMGFTVGCQVAEFANQFPVRAELRKRIFKRLREEGISVPLPTRTIYVHGVKSDANGSDRKS